MVTRRLARRCGGCWAVVATLVATLVGGCVVSPQPSPPLVEPTLDGGRIDMGVASSTVKPGELAFVAEPGAVDPPEGVVVVTNLDTRDVPTLVEVRDDGSFAVFLKGIASDTVRFQVKQGDLRAEPADLTIDPRSGEVLPASVELECLKVEPKGWLSLDGAGDERSVAVQSACGEDVVIEAPRLRRGGGPFSVDAPASLVIAAGGSAVITVSADGTGNEREDVLFLDVTGPVVARRALTLTRPD